RPARHGHPQLGDEARLRERLAVGTRDAELLPGIVRMRGLVRAAPACAYLVAPVLAAPVFAAVDQITRATPECVVRLAEWIDLAVAVVVEADIEPDFRHPLRVAHGARPRADHLLRIAPAFVHDAQRVDQLRLPVRATAGLAPGERSE